MFLQVNLYRALGLYIRTWTQSDTYVLVSAFCLGMCVYMRACGFNRTVIICIKIGSLSICYSSPRSYYSCVNGQSECFGGDHIKETADGKCNLIFVKFGLNNYYHKRIYIHLL